MKTDPIERIRDWVGAVDSDSRPPRPSKDDIRLLLKLYDSERKKKPIMKSQLR